jgi:hypothetical protein
MNGHPNEWAVAYHGSGSHLNNIQSIIKENLKVGSGQSYSNHKNINIETQI